MPKRGGGPKIGGRYLTNRILLELIEQRKRETLYEMLNRQVEEQQLQEFALEQTLWAMEREHQKRQVEAAMYAVLLSEL